MVTFAISDTKRYSLRHNGVRLEYLLFFKIPFCLTNNYQLFAL